VNRPKEFTEVDERLPRVKEILDCFDASNIKYCHWKSNEHAMAAVRGDTDLDILFDNNQYDLVQSILMKAGFVKFKTAWFLRYPYIEDFLAIDPVEGKIIHVHAHFKLIVGESRVKSYHLSWESDFINKRYFLENEKIYAAPAAEEMLLLVVRSVLKLPIIKFSKYEKRSDSIDAKREFKWLKERVKKSDLIDLTRMYLGEGSIAVISEMYAGGINYSSLRKLKKVANEKLSEFRRYSIIRAIYLRSIRYLFSRFAAVNKRFPLLEVSNHRSISGSGLIVAVLGADGSGKSTQVKKIKHALSKKMDAKYVYLGAGNGPASWHRLIVQSFFNIYKNLISKKHARTKTKLKNVIEKNVNANPSFLKLILAVSLASEKKSKLNQVKKAKERGAIVITDRYPQVQNIGFNDGPIVPRADENSSFIKIYITSYIYRCYNYSSIIKPDLVVKLVGDPAELYLRRSDEMSKEDIAFKQEGVVGLDFDKTTKVLEVDACFSKEEVTKKIMSEIGGFFFER